MTSTIWFSDRDVFIVDFSRTQMNDLTIMEFVGFIATGLTTGSLVPQVLKMYKTKDVSSISLNMYIMYFTGILLWVAYGFHLNSIPIHVSNFFGFVFSLSIIWMKIKYRNQEIMVISKPPKEEQ